MDAASAGTALVAALMVVGLAYLLGLFAFAYWAEGARGRPMVRRWRLPAYALALAVYCSSWTFYGAVGSAARDGWAFLPIYLGPILVFLFGARLLGRLVAVAHSEGSGSIADFIGGRFSRSRSVSALVTLIALAGTIPYLALQLRSVGQSFLLVSGGSDAFWPMAGTAVLLGGFAMLFGTRRYEASARNDGVLAAIAAESLVKIVAFIALALFAALLFLDLPLASRSVAVGELGDNFAPGRIGGDFLVATLLAATAIICLPRQFHITVVEASSPADPVRARPMFVAYLALIALLVLPITIAAMALPELSGNADLVVLALPLAAGVEWLTILVFLGGLAAATGMVIVECIALSTMVSNDLIAPWLLDRNRSAAPGRAGAQMLNVRRLVIVGTMAASLGFATATPSGAALASMGLVAFAAMAQFTPALLLAIRRGGRDPVAATAGLATGFALWIALLLVPALSGAATIDLAGLVPGLSGFSAAALLSLAANGAVHGLFALRTVRGADVTRRGVADIASGSVATAAELADFVARFVGSERAAELVTATDAARPIDRALARRAERMIAEVIGAASSRSLVSAVLAGTQLTAQDVARLLDETGQSLQFSKGLLAATLEHIDPGVSVIDRDLKLVAWNSRYLDLFAYPEGLVAVGVPVAELIEYNALRGECGPGEVDQHVAKRLDHMRRGTRHSFERVRPDGRVIKTVGGPMPGGGYVMCFTDITAEAQARAALEAERQALERRVAERTDALSSANAALQAAAHDKTRFLAAASHDVMQPLHATRLFLSALEGDVGPAGRQLLDRAMQSVAGGEELLRTLLDISRIDAGGVVPQPQVFALRPLLRDLATTATPLARSRGLSIRLGPGDAWIVSDPALVRSIVQNLIANAVRYTESGGIVIGVRRRSGQALVEIWDSGPGIPADKQQAIFREFERLDRGGDTGVGLGLAIVDRTARLLGASVSVRSRPGQGSCFAVAFDRVEPVAAAEAMSTATRQSEQRLSILVVDDDRAVCAASEAALVRWGHHVTIAHSAAEALAIEGRFDAALVDFDLGDSPDGLTLITALRTRRQVGGALLITGNASVTLADAAARAGVEMLAKPVDIAALRDWLARVAPIEEAAAAQ